MTSFFFKFCLYLLPTSTEAANILDTANHLKVYRPALAQLYIILIFLGIHKVYNLSLQGFFQLRIGFCLKNQIHSLKTETCEQ